MTTTTVMIEFKVSELGRDAKPIWKAASENPILIRHTHRVQDYVIMTKERFDELMGK